MLDRADLAAAVARHGTVMRVAICSFQGSSPREAGASMLVWPEGQSGTIGGGALEFYAADTARQMLLRAESGIDRIALGPSLGQCCGGAVTLAFEVFDQARLAEIPPHGLFARRISASAPAVPPLAIQKAQRAERSGSPVSCLFAQGWLAEPVSSPERPFWVWGAGHVGRAIISVMAPLPDVAITWIDTDRARFPERIPSGIVPLFAQDPLPFVADAPGDANHVILTYSHALDLELCHHLLGHGFKSCGLIGSASKWARFQSRLKSLGHDPAQISRIRCPIGDPALGKHPQAIAISVAASYLLPAVAAQPYEVAS